MEYKSNNGAYARFLSQLSSLRQIHRLHGRQILLPQFNYRPHATFMTIIIPFLGGQLQCVTMFFCMLSCLHAVHAHCSIRHHVRKGSEISENTNWTMGNNKTKATHDI